MEDRALFGGGTRQNWLPADELELIEMAIRLGAADVGGALSIHEEALIKASVRRSAGSPIPAETVRWAAEQIRSGGDPLGAALYRLRPPIVRRSDGAVYTPPAIVDPIIEWARHYRPDRIVDAGSGSGRFSAEIGRLALATEVVAVDSDPVATIMTRASLACIKTTKVRVLHADYTRLQLPPIDGRTAFIGNPPYVRHHQLAHKTKAWAQVAAARVGHRISGLAGLHAYFFLATAVIARPGDIGCFVTSAEWLDVNYGAIIRELLLGQLGGLAIHVIEPTALPFDDAATTAAITCFQVGQKPSTIKLRSVKAADKLVDLDQGRPVSRARLAEAPRWSVLVRTSGPVPAGFVQLGELCRVHRGAVTGLNSIWITLAGAVDLPDEVLFPTITKARELFEAGDCLSSAQRLRLVIDLPADLDGLDASHRARVDRFLKLARKAGAAAGYVAQYRKAWWSVGLRDPAPILATYMARRPPAFVRNLVEARHINIAHGLYPRIDMSPVQLDRLASALRKSVSVRDGRTYAGGLTKFEPREMERLHVPDISMLTSPAWQG